MTMFKELNAMLLSTASYRHTAAMGTPTSLNLMVKNSIAPALLHTILAGARRVN
jgi:hypothetical protein